MSDSNHPYHVWLGLAPTLDRPSYYDLLGLPPRESDTARIKAAADRALSRVRAQRPGRRASEWAQLLDELQAAKRCLADPQRKAAYDATLPADSPENLDAKLDLPPVEPSERWPPFDDAGSDFAISDAADGFDAELPPKAVAPIEPPPLPEPADSPTHSPDSASKFLHRHPIVPGGPLSNARGIVTPRRTRFRRRNNVALPLLGITALLAAGAALVYWQVAEAWKETAGPALAQDSSHAEGRNQRAPNLQAPRRLTEVPRVAKTRAAQNSFGAPTHVDVGAHQEPPWNGDGSDVGEQPQAEMPHGRGMIDTEAAAIGEPPEQVILTPADTTEMPASSNSSVASADSSEPPSSEDVLQLGELLVAARTAMAEQRFDDADQHLIEADRVARLPEHRAMVDRLRKLGSYAREFPVAVRRGLQKLEAGATLPLVGDEPAVIVERERDAVKVRWRGQNFTFSLDKLPIALGVPLAQQGSDGSPRALVIHGAFVALHKRANEEHIEQVRAWWQEAIDAGEPIDDQLPVLQDFTTQLGAPN